MKAEEDARQRWQEKFDRETREKEEARTRHRKHMQAECLRMQNEQIAMHKDERERARQEAIRLKGVMKEQARQEKEERQREREDELDRGRRYQVQIPCPAPRAHPCRDLWQRGLDALG